jgi:hypothetical protein
VGSSEFAVAGDAEGMGARFEGFPPNLCAERLWTVVVGIDGEPGVSGDSSLTRVELLKHNTFASRVCGGGGLQSATVAPGRNLFLDPKYQSALAEIFDRPNADAYSRAAFGAVRTNVSREAFEEQAYDQGAQTGFAGRGLFGQYALFFPAESLRYEVCGEDGCTTHNETGLDLSRVNDVLLRFEYVAWSSAN